MEKLYGYREKDVRLLIDEINTKKGQSLSQIFSSVAIKIKKAKGTIRNMYYAVAKLSSESESFRKEYLGGRVLTVLKSSPFSEREKEALISEIEKGKKENISARKTILRIANGDAKLALRLQNKYRNAMQEFKQKNAFIEPKSVVSEFYYAKLKKEINGLVDKISDSVLNENKILKEKILKLEQENASLYKKISLIEGGKDTKEFFINSSKKALLN